MSGVQTAGEDRRHLLLFVQSHVDNKIRRAQTCTLIQGFPQRIAVQHSPGSLGMSDKFRPMHMLDNPLRCHSRNHRLGAAAEAGKEMRLNKAQQNPEVRIDIGTMQLHGCTVRQSTDCSHSRGVGRTRLLTSVAAQGFFSYQLSELFPRIGSMSAQSVQESDLSVRNANL